MGDDSKQKQGQRRLNFNSLRLLHPRSLKHLSGYIDHLVQGRLWLKILIAMVIGLGCGLLLGPSAGLVDPKHSDTLGGWLSLPGYLFLGIIQMVVIPLIFSSVIRGLAASEDAEQLKSVGLKAVVYFILTTTLAIILGISVTRLINPGAYLAESARRSIVKDSQLPEAATDTDILDGSIPERIVSLLPANPVESVVQSEMLQIVIFAVFIGIALLTLSHRQAKPLLDLLGSIQAVSMQVVNWSMYLAPLAVFGLMANLTSQVGLDVLKGMSVYVGTVLLGLFLLVIVYMLIIALIGRSNPFVFLAKIRDVQLLAFSTSSSAAVMPVSIRTADRDLKVRPSISQFIIPLGATINMDGTALYQGSAAIFLAQVYGVDLTLGALVLVVVTAVSASIGAPSAPGVGIVILASVLESVGIPTAGIALLLGVDRILDMSRTAVNVTGDLTACVVMDRLVGSSRSHAEEIAQEESREEQRSDSGEDVVGEEGLQESARL